MNGRIVWLFHLLCYTGAALQMTGPSTYEARVGSIAHIPCTFTADILPADPKFFAVFWHLEGKRVLSYDNTVISTDPRYSLDIDQALNGAADLTISNTFLSDGGIYTCSVTNSPIQREKQIKVEISGAALQMTGPSTYTARVGSSTNIPCTFTADTLPVDPTFFAIVWYLEKKRILTYDNTVTSTHPRYSLDKDQALNGIVNLTISNPSVSDGGVYTCSVNYSSFQLERKIRVDVSAQPQLFILDKSVQRNTENNLTCMANGYFPNDITVTWYKDGEVLKNQSMGEPLKYTNGTYQVKSTVTIIPSDNDLNKTFSCRIQHVSLQEPLQEEFQLTYQESSSRVGIIIIPIVIVVVIIGIGIIAAVILCRRRIRRKASDRAPPSGQQVIYNEQSIEVRDENRRLLNTNEALSQTSHDFSEGQESHSKPPVNRQDSGHSGLHTVPDNQKSTTYCTASLSDSCSVDPQDISDSTQSSDTQNGDSGKGQAAQQPNTALSQVSHDFSEGQESHSKPSVNRQDSGHSGLHTMPDNRKSTTDCTASLSDSCTVDPHHILDRPQSLDTQNGDSGKPQAAQQPKTALSQISHDFSEGQESHSKPSVNRQDSEHSGFHTMPDNRKSTTDCTVSLSDSCSIDPQDILNRTQNGDSGKPQSAQQPKTAGNQGGLNQAKNTSSEHQSNSGHPRTSLPKHQATKPLMGGNKDHLNVVKDAYSGVKVSSMIKNFESGTPI